MVSTTKAIGIAVIILFIAFAFPQFIGGADRNTAEDLVTITGGVGDSVEVEDAFLLTLSDKNAGTVDITVISDATGDNATVTLTEGDSANVTIDNQTIQIQAIYVETATGGDVTLQVRYPNNFAWGDQAIRLGENMEIIFAAVALIVVLMLVAGMVRL